MATQKHRKASIFAVWSEDGASTLHVFQEAYEPLPTFLLHPSVFH